MPKDGQDREVTLRIIDKKTIKSKINLFMDLRFIHSYHYCNTLLNYSF